jgi:hypothetical protein
MRYDSRRNSDGVTWELTVFVPSNTVRTSAAVISHKKNSKSTSRILYVYLKNYLKNYSLRIHIVYHSNFEVKSDRKLIVKK